MLQILYAKADIDLFRTRAVTEVTRAMAFFALNSQFSFILTPQAPLTHELQKGHSVETSLTSKQFENAISSLGVQCFNTESEEQ